MKLVYEKPKMEVNEFEGVDVHTGIGIHGSGTGEIVPFGTEGVENATDI